MILRPFKKISEQEEVIRKLSHTINEYEHEEKEREKKERSGNHNVGIWCIGCKNLLEKVQYNPISCEYMYRFCKLDCKCDDRKENE